MFAKQKRDNINLYTSLIFITLFVIIIPGEHWVEINEMIFQIINILGWKIYQTYNKYVG